MFISCVLISFTLKKKKQLCHSVIQCRHRLCIFAPFSPVCMWRRLRWLHRPSRWASVVSLCADDSHQSHLPAPIPAATIHCQAAGHCVPASTKCPAVHGLRQGSSLWVNKTKFKVKVMHHLEALCRLTSVFLLFKQIQNFYLYNTS